PIAADRSIRPISTRSAGQRQGLVFGRTVRRPADVPPGAANLWGSSSDRPSNETQTANGPTHATEDMIRPTSGNCVSWPRALELIAAPFRTRMARHAAIAISWPAIRIGSPFSAARPLAARVALRL